MNDNFCTDSPGIASFVAVGDSFTEGLNDPAPGGGFAGWADRLAGMLAAQYPGLRYANLAVRGKLLREIVAEQVPAALAMSPSLVGIAGGGNDILRPGADPDTLAELFDAAVARLCQDGCRVLMFTGFDPVAFPVLRLLRGRIAAYNMHLRAIADARGCDLVDLWSMRFLRDIRAWSPDRLHLAAESHRRVALRACAGPARRFAAGLRDGTRFAHRDAGRHGGRRAGPCRLGRRPPRRREVGPGAPRPLGQPPPARHLHRRRPHRETPRTSSREVKGNRSESGRSPCRMLILGPIGERIVG